MPGAEILRERLAEHFDPQRVDELMNRKGTWVGTLFHAHCAGVLYNKRCLRLDRIPGGFRITYGRLRDLRKVQPDMVWKKSPMCSLHKPK